MENNPPAAPTPSAATEDKTVAILAYVTIIGFIVAIIMHGNKKTRLGSFHLRQVLGLIISYFVCGMCMIVPILGWIVGFCGFLFLFVLVVMGFIGAIQGSMKPVPVLGAHYQKWFGNAFD